MPDRSERPLLSRSDNQERSVHYSRESPRLRRHTPPGGAFMEPRGCNRWQSVANRLSAETAETRQNRCRGCDRLPETFHGKEGVDGSSPSEDLYEMPVNRHFSSPVR